MNLKINEAAGVCLATAAIAGIVAVFAWLSIKQNIQPAEAPQTSHTLSAQSDSGALSGTVGANLTWQFDAQTATLTIDGEGDMDARLGREKCLQREHIQGIRHQHCQRRGHLYGG